MTRIRALDADNATLAAEAGVTLAGVQSAAAEAGLAFPLSLASEGSCTIGGNLSTNAGGTAVLRYGNAREQVLGLEVVLADGGVLDMMRGLRKDNTGYDLKQLFIGAEGTLGIITAAVLKLQPAPRSRVTALAACGERRRRHRAPARAAPGARRPPRRLRADERRRPRPVAQAPSRHARPPARPPLVRARAGGRQRRRTRALGDRVETALAVAIDRGAALDATVARSGAQAAALWAARENISEAQRREGPNLKHDISMPVSAIPAFLDEAEHALSAAFPGVRYVVFGHLGDGNLHYNLSAPAGHGRRGLRRLRRARARAADRARPRRRARRGRSRPSTASGAEARRAGAAQVAARTRGHAQRQGRARPGRDAQPGQDPLTPGTGIHDGQDRLLDRRRVRRAVRRAPLSAAAQAKKRRERERRPRQRRGPMVRCAKCGVFVPRADAIEGPGRLPLPRTGNCLPRGPSTRDDRSRPGDPAVRAAAAACVGDRLGPPDPLDHRRSTARSAAPRCSASRCSST